HLQNVVNAFAVIVHFEDAALVACASAFFADEFDIGEKLHFDGHSAVALAGFAAATGNIERKMAGGVAAAPGVGGIRKDFANGVKGFHVGGRIRARRAPNGRLIHDDDFFYVLVALKFVAKFLFGSAIFLRGKRAIKNVVHEGGFAGTADARDHN